MLYAIVEKIGDLKKKSFLWMIFFINKEFVIKYYVFPNIFAKW